MKQLLELTPRFYPGDDKVAQWATDASAVKAVINAGKIPQIVLPGFDEKAKAPVVAVILAREPSLKKEEDDYCIHPDYINALQSQGLRPVMIAYDKIREQLHQARPKGLFLIGGCFNSPADWYDERPAVDADKRALTYLQLIAYAKRNKLPVLGICAGHQMIAGSEGAKLIKGINKNLPDDKSHKQPPYQIAHEVIIEPGSLLHKIIGKERIQTNSSHSEALVGNSMGACLISARAEDGVIEAMELKKPWNSFILGVQWHPERLLKLGDENSQKIFKSFAEAVRER